MPRLCSSHGLFSLLLGGKFGLMHNQLIGWHMCFGCVVVSVCDVLCWSDVVIQL